MKDKDLLGTLVLVHPDLENHPAGREGDIGIVAYVDSRQSEIYLRFTDYAEAVYPADALFMLKQKEQLFPGGPAAVAADTLENYKDLYKIGVLQDMGRSTDIWRALEIARDNPAIRAASLVSVEESLGLHHNHYVGR
jgi:hypothetical protein